MSSVLAVAALAIAMLPAAASAAVGEPGTTTAFSATVNGLPMQGSLSVGVPQQVSAASAVNKPAAVSNSCTIWFQPGWSLTMNSILWGIAWSETQKGAYYYGCGWVWQAPRYGWDNQGYHTCAHSSGTGFTVTVTNCYRTGDPSTSYLKDEDDFTVSFLFSGFPISGSHSMAVCPTPSGSIPTCVWN